MQSTQNKSMINNPNNQNNTLFTSKIDTENGSTIPSTQIDQN